MWVGVDLFFVLSGFLITGILYDSLHDPRFFRNFYTRRALRIFPLYYGFFLCLFLLTPVLHIQYRSSILLYFAYVGNLAMPFCLRVGNNPTTFQFMLHGHEVYGNIGHFWSLCVEEQFYVIWPAIVWFVRSRASLMRVCVGGCLLVLLVRIVAVAYLGRFGTFMHFLSWYTFTRADTLMVGAWLALWLRGRTLSLVQLRRLSGALFYGVVGIFVLCSHILPPAVYGPGFATVGYTLIALAGAGLVLRSLDDSSRFSRVLRLRFLSALGAISYGFYLVHHLYMYEFLDLYNRYAIVHRFGFLIPFVAFALSWALAALSFRYLESPFLRLKSRLAPQWVPQPAPAFGEGPGSDFVPVALHVSEPRPEPQ